MPPADSIPRATVLVIAVLERPGRVERALPRPQSCALGEVLEDARLPTGPGVLGAPGRRREEAPQHRLDGVQLALRRVAPDLRDHHRCARPARPCRPRAAPATMSWRRKTTLKPVTGSKLSSANGSDLHLAYADVGLRHESRATASTPRRRRGPQPPPRVGASSSATPPPQPMSRSVRAADGRRGRTPPRRLAPAAPRSRPSRGRGCPRVVRCDSRSRWSWSPPSSAPPGRL